MGFARRLIFLVLTMASFATQASASYVYDALDELIKVRLTPEHPVYVAGRNGEEPGWVMAGELVAGDLLADIDGGALVKVVDNALTETEEIVYNFEVENAHSRSRGSALEHRLDQYL